MTSQSEGQGAALAARYGGADFPANIRWNPTIETILGNRSVRGFLPDPLPDGTLETLVAAAQSASSSSNMHQWSVIAVTDPALKSQLADLSRITSLGMAQTWIDEAPLLLLWVADLSRTFAIGEAMGETFDAVDYFDSFLTASIDASLAAQNAIVAARSLGLGTVCLGAMRNRAAEVARLVGLPPRSIVVFGVSVGREDPARPSPVRPRPAQQVALHRERYQAEEAARSLADYEETMKTFQAAQGQKVRGWNSYVAHLSKGTAYLDGRENLRQTLHDQGFELL